MNSNFRHHGDSNDAGFSSAGSSSASYESYESFPDGMTEEESLQIWLRRNDEIGEQVLRERRQQEQQHQPLGGGEAASDHHRGSASGSPGVVRSRGSSGSAGSRSSGDRGGSSAPAAARPDWHEDPGAIPFPFDDQAPRDAQLHYQHLIDLNQARLERQQELEREARRQEREARQREREATQRLEEAIQHREALERRVYAEAPVENQDAVPRADQAWEYDRLLQAQYAMAMAVQENDAMRREEEAHQRRMRAANDAMQREEEAHQRWMRAVAQHHEILPGAMSNDYAMGGSGVARACPQNAAPLAAQAGEYERPSQAHYAMSAEANDARQREEEVQQQRMCAAAHHFEARPDPTSNDLAMEGVGATHPRFQHVSPLTAQAREHEPLSQVHCTLASQLNNTDSCHRPSAAITTANSNNNSSNNYMNDSASSAADYSGGGDKAMEGDGGPETSALTTTKNIDKSSSNSTNDSASITTSKGCGKDQKPEEIFIYLATLSPTQYNTQPVVCMNCNASLYTPLLAQSYHCQRCGSTTTLKAEEEEMGKSDADVNMNALVNSLEEKMMDLWDYGFDNEGMDMA